MKVLVIRFSSIGDIVLTTPVVRALKQNLDNGEVHYCTKKQYQSLVNHNPYIDRVHFLEDSLSALIKTLRKERYDLIIDLHHNLRTRIISLALGVKTHRFRKLNLEKWLMVRFKWNRLPNVHIVDRYLETLATLDIKPDSQGLDFFIPDRDVVEKSWFPPSHQKEYIVYAIGGKHNTKKLPLKRMIELCDRVNKPVVLLGGKEDYEIGEQIVNFFTKSDVSGPFEESLEQLNKKAVIFNGCGKFNLNQSASVIQEAKAVFTHDTGMMHIAAALQRPIYSIWGNTIPEFGMYPYKTRFVIFENNKIDCRPCSKIGYDKCPKGHFKCMNELVFDFYIP